MDMKNLFIALLGLIALAACSNEADVATNENEGRVPIRLQCGQKAITRATAEIQGSQFDPGEHVTVYITENNNGKTVYTPMVYQITGIDAVTNLGTMTPSGNIYPYYPTSGNSVKIQSLYPKSVTKSTTTFAVKYDQIEDGNYMASDLMYAEIAEAESTTPVQTLTYNHLLSKVSVQLVKGTGGPELSGASVQICDVDRAIAFSGETGVLGSSFSNQTYPRGAVTVTGNSGSNVRSVIIPPQQRQPGKLIKILLASNDIIYYSLNQTMNFQSGHAYKFVITVNQNNLEVTHTVSDWNNLEGEQNIYTDTPSF